MWALGDNLNTNRDWIDSSGTVLEHRNYDPFGNLLAQTGSEDITFEWTGRYHDDVTGLQYNTNRWYDAHTGRWLSQDPIGFEAGDMNLYRYVANSPIIFVDPSGLQIDSVTVSIRKCLELPTAAARAQCLDGVLSILKDNLKPTDLAKLREALSSQKELARQFGNLRNGIDEYHRLKECLRNAKGKRLQESLKKQIHDLVDGPEGIKGDIKKVRQRYGEDVFKEMGDILKPFRR